MRKIKKTRTFEKQWVKFTKSGDKLTKKAKIELREAIRYMQAEQPLPDKYVDHPLKGCKGNVRDCHILNDLVLIYEIVEKDGEEYINLLTIKNHSQTFG